METVNFEFRGSLTVSVNPYIKEDFWIITITSSAWSDYLVLGMELTPSHTQTRDIFKLYNFEYF